MRMYVLARYHRLRQEAVEYLGGKCAVCGSTNELDFDHIDPSSKEVDIARLASLSLKKFWAEVEKCQLLCEEHHCRKTVAENGKEWVKGTDKHGTVSTARYCGPPKCKECRAAINKANAERKKKTGWEPKKKSAVHGSSSMYSYQKCRCDLCREGQRIRQKEFNARKRVNKIA